MNVNTIYLASRAAAMVGKYSGGVLAAPSDYTDADQAIIAKLEDAFNKIARDPEVAKFLYNIGADPFPGSMAQLKSLMVSDMDAWGKYVDLAKIEKL